MAATSTESTSEPEALSQALLPRYSIRFILLATAIAALVMVVIRQSIHEDSTFARGFLAGGLVMLACFIGYGLVFLPAMLFSNVMRDAPVSLPKASPGTNTHPAERTR